MKMKCGLRILHIDQKGLTLVELIVAIAITALIGSAVAVASFQLVKVNARSTNHQFAVSMVQNGVNSISRDIAQAQNINPMNYNNIAITVNGSNQIVFDLTKNPNGDKLELKWVAWDNTTKHNTTNDVIYTVVNKVLQKTITITIDNGIPSTITMVVANNITTASGNWNTYTRTLTLTIRADVGTSNTGTEIRTLQIIPRPAH
jgi:prepilin-type N-terminal cleavage/methylation domain-containing protein